MSLLVVDGVQRRFAGRGVLTGVSLTIDAGESVALMGPSGCGKTTLLQMIGLLDQPDAGAITLDGHDVTALRPAARAELRLRTIGFVFQHSNLIDHLTARDNVALPAWRAGLGHEQAGTRADALLERLGIAALGSSTASTLSIGEAQRVAVARALVNAPRLILADEPTGSLDAESAQLVLAALLEAGAGESAVLVVTHDPEVAARARRTVRMRDGKLSA